MNSIPSGRPRNGLALLSACSLLLCFASPGSAQTQVTVPKAAPIPQLVKLVQGAPVRGQFETSDEFKARVEAWRTKAQPGVPSADKPIAVRIPLLGPGADKWQRLTWSYDPDTETAVFKIPNTSYYQDAVQYATVRADTDVKLIRSYTATNNFGVRTKVSVFNKRTVQLVLPESLLGKEVSMQIPRSVAKDLSTLGAAFFVGTLTEPWYARQKFRESPTIREPFEINEEVDHVFLNPTALVVARMLGGSVAFSVDLTLQPSAPPSLN